MSAGATGWITVPPMRAVQCSEFAPLDRLEVVDIASPPCGPGQVRIEVSACGVNFVDALIVQGLYQLKPKLPFVPGGELAGRVSEVGDGVTTHRVGDRVFASAGLSGGFATEAVVPAAAAIHTPDAMTDTQAATFVQSYMTARFALAHRARAESGQWLLVLGAGGGVGLAAVDVGSAMGLHVIAAASSDDKRAVAMAHGAVAAIDTSTEDTKTRARELADGDGVDLVYDPVGGAAGEQALRALRDDGQLLVIGFASGDIPKLPANQVLLRNRRVTGVDWGGWSVGHREENRAILDSLVADIAAGSLHPVEPMTMPLDRAADALRDQQERRVTGKMALLPN